VLWRQRQVRHRRLDGETPWSSRSPRRTQGLRGREQTGALEPRTRAPHGRRARRRRRPCATEGSRRTETERLQRQREGEAARTRMAWRDAIPAECCRSMPARRAKGGEYRHELNTHGSRQVAATRLGASSRPSKGAGWFPRQRRVGGARAQGARSQSRRSRGCLAEGHPPKEGGGLCPEYGSSRTKRSHGLAR
jgi:hypothetical protein